MNSFLKTICLSLLLLLSIACTNESVSIDNSTEQNLEAQVLLDVSYGNDPQQVYDLYLPANRNSSKTKIIVLVHGGGWIEGDKADMQNYIELLQSAFPDHAFANVNYRLAQIPSRKAFPNQFNDLSLALDHLTSNAGETNTKSQFALIGVSAGAHLSLFYDSVYDEEDRVKAVCSIVGPTNLDDDFYKENPQFSIAIPFFIDATAYPNSTNLAQSVSPAYQINSKTSPTILFYGDQDDLVPISNATLLKERLNANTIYNQLSVYEGGHGSWSAESNIDLQNKLSLFLRTYLKIE